MSDPNPIEPTPPPPEPTHNHTFGVLMAFALPIVGTVVIVSLIGVIGFGLFNLAHRLIPKRPPEPPLLTTPDPPQTPAPARVPTTRPVGTIQKKPMTTQATAPPVIPEVIPPAPVLTSFTDSGFGPGMMIAVNGDNLDPVTRIELISTAGAKSVDTEVISRTNTQLVVKVPEVSFADDDMIIVVHSKGGIAMLIDEHTGATPWGTDGHLHDTIVIAKTGDSIETRDRMVLLAQNQSEVSVGDDSVAFLSDHVTLKSHGKNCRIYYVSPVKLGPGVSKVGLIQVPSIKVQDPAPAFRMKPAQ